VTLRAIATPGHTQGATIWLTEVEEDGDAYAVAFRGGEIPNAGSPLVDNPRHANVVADTQRTLNRLRTMEAPDLFLHNHPQSPRALNPDLPINPQCTTCLDAEGFRDLVEGVDTTFQGMLREAGAVPER
jgi:glyoxylase-like metal-dependent hydrolase (beta-lactamase superfamily II)